MPNATSSNPSEPLTPAVFHILLALAITERHGYGIMKQAELDSVGHVKMGPGTLYGTIKRLLTAELIIEASEQVDNTLDDQRRRYYRITPAGLAALGAELERYEAVVHAAKLGRVLPRHNTSTATAQ